MIHLTIAQEKDFETIAQLAKVIWNEHYVSIIGQTQVDYMLAKIYNYQSLMEQMHHKKHVFYLIQSNHQSIGFISVSSDNGAYFFLHKFYIQQQIANKGIGTEVLEILIKTISPKSLTLTVNRQNYKSINFYFKNGFKIDRVEDFDIGDGYQMNDFVMIKNI